MKEDWDKNFFQRPIEEIDQFGKDMTLMLMLNEEFDVTHLKELHELGYLPIKIKSITEGTFIPYKVPMFTIVNTKPLNGTIVDWLVNYLETILSAESWQAPTSASLGFEFRKLSHEWITKTDPDNLWLIDYQNHDFSMRGQQGKSAIVNSGLGWAVCSRGSDTLPVIPAARKYYDEPTNEVVINSVLATEHAIMCSLTGFFMKNGNGDWDKVADFEYEMFVYLLNKFPSGILSLVMDTWDLWRSVTQYCKKAKDIILARDGKVVIRPDSCPTGQTPVDIICGTLIGNNGNTPAEKGVIECLYDIFGGDVSSTGFKRLDPHIGAIYGDSINLERALDMYTRLANKGFASTNIVLGVGSYSLAFVTRDTHGMAQKATYIEVGGKGIEVFKDPITDSGFKKSARGLLMVQTNEVNDEYELIDQVDFETESKGELKVIFEDGKFFNTTTLTAIRERVDQLLQKSINNVLHETV